jgi:hypothetical protein
VRTAVTPGGGRERVRPASQVAGHLGSGHPPLWRVRLAHRAASAAEGRLLQPAQPSRQSRIIRARALSALLRGVDSHDSHATRG